MSDRTQGPWKWHSRIEDLDGRGPLQTGSIYAEPTKGHAYSVAVAPKYQTEQRWKADAAAIVLWENHFDELVKTMEEVQKFIDPAVDPSRLTNQEICGMILAVLAKVKK
jgi:hypothetical protein